MSDNILRIQVCEEVQVLDVFGAPTIKKLPPTFSIAEVLVEFFRVVFASPLLLPRPPTAIRLMKAAPSSRFGIAFIASSF